jgi:hypothetical protein
MFELIERPTSNTGAGKLGCMPVYFQVRGTWYELDEVEGDYAWTAHKRFNLDRVTAFAYYHEN